MKKYIAIRIFCLAVLPVCLASCSDWLEVKSDTKIVDTELFKDPRGFHNAVNGVYTMLAEADLYGRNLTYGMLSVLGNTYNDSWIPSYYSDLAKGDYTTTRSQGYIEAVWKKAYAAIANCNSIITQARGKDAAFFTNTGYEKDLIIGEMLVVRGMLHFDLLRLFAPIPSQAGDNTYIPYQDEFPRRESLHLTVGEILDRAIADLSDGKRLLESIDTRADALGMRTVAARFNTFSVPIEDEFFRLRGTRMNWFSTTVILARAYQWKGEAKSAYDAAADMYDFNKENGWFFYTLSTNLDVTPERVYRKMPEDILFGPYDELLYDITEKEVDGTRTLRVKNHAHLFGADTDDFRLIRLIGTDTYAKSLRWERIADITLFRLQGPTIPVVRMSEAVYIMCEYLIGNGRLEEARTLLGEVRYARGAKSPVTAGNADDMREVLYNEMTREFLSEGQTFFLYKRLGRPIYNGNTPKDMTGKYVLPVPYSETAYL